MFRQSQQQITQQLLLLPASSLLLLPATICGQSLDVCNAYIVSAGVSSSTQALCLHVQCAAHQIRVTWQYHLALLPEVSPNCSKQPYVHSLFIHHWQQLQHQ